jgi:uncharacterized protein YndB with AHSA1/START domain
MSRRIENRIDVPGTPEQVWEAIATGPGIEAWFVPARVEDGRVALDMGSGLEDAGTVTEFSPPHRFAHEEEWAVKDVMRTNVHLYLFEDSAAVAALQAPAWRDWMAVPSAT